MIRCVHHKQSGDRLSICLRSKCKGYKEHKIMQKCPEYEAIRKCAWSEGKHSDVNKPDEKASLQFEPCASKKCDGFDREGTRTESPCELHMPMPEDLIR